MSVRLLDRQLEFHFSLSLSPSTPIGLERSHRLQPFGFVPFTKKLNWKKIRALNLDRMVRDADQTLMTQGWTLNFSLQPSSVPPVCPVLCIWRYGRAMAGL